MISDEYIEYIRFLGKEGLLVDSPGMIGSPPEPSPNAVEVLVKRLKEARTAFDAAMEYADSAECADCQLTVGVYYTKPHPIAPWKG